MKILGGETNLNAPISVGSASVVRVFNGDSSNLLVTRKTSGGTTVGTFMVPAGEVVYCEKDYTDTLEGSANLKVTQVAFSPMMSFVGQDSAGPTYTHSVSATAVDEGGNFTTTITTTNVADGTNLYWELTGVSSDDFSSGALTGTASISSNSATFSHTVANDTLTEGTETVTIKVYSDSGRNTQVGNTLTVTLADTSLTPPTPYSTFFDGNSALTIPDDDGWSLGQTFTIEAFFRIGGTLNNYQTIVSQSDGGDDWYMSVIHTGALQFFDFSGGEQIESAAGAITYNTWYHVAFVGNGGTGQWYVNGSASGSSGSININGGSNGLKIGRQNNYNYDWTGFISNLRITKGQAIYTSNFTKPSQSLTLTSQGATASNVVLLCCNKGTPSNGTGSTKTPGTITMVGNATYAEQNPF